MTRVASIPAETDVLCEACGYVLNGLPPESNCPECGRPAADSSATLRQPSPWEQAIEKRSGLKGLAAGFIRTTLVCIFRPTRFFRHLSVTPHKASRQFAVIHWLTTSALFGAALAIHLDWSGTILPSDNPLPRWLTAVLLVAFAFVCTIGLNWIAARLTAWEAAYRGYRLPLPVVRRGLDYHTPHYLPVAVVVAAVVVAYHFLVRRWPIAANLQATTYLYVLSAVIVLGALYLFKTYWTAMRNLMYANR